MRTQQDKKKPAVNDYPVKIHLQTAKAMRNKIEDFNTVNAVAGEAYLTEDEFLVESDY